jgi:hypothetical protein
MASSSNSSPLTCSQVQWSLRNWAKCISNKSLATTRKISSSRTSLRIPRQLLNHTNWSPGISMLMSTQILPWIIETHSLLSYLSKQQGTLGTKRTSTVHIVLWMEVVPLLPRKITNNYNLERLHKKDSQLPRLQKALIIKQLWIATPNLCKPWASKERSRLHHTLATHKL